MKAEGIIRESSKIEQDFRRLHESAGRRRTCPPISWSFRKTTGDPRNGTHHASAQGTEGAGGSPARDELVGAIDLRERKSLRIKYRFCSLNSSWRKSAADCTNWQVRFLILACTMSTLPGSAIRGRSRAAAEEPYSRRPPGPRDVRPPGVEFSKVIPLLDRFAAVRTTLRDATKRSTDLEHAGKEIRESGEKVKAIQADLKDKLDLATQARQHGDEATTETRTVFQQAKSATAAVRQLEGSRVCRSCGQPLTPAHWKLERAKRQQDLEAAIIRHANAVAAQRGDQSRGRSPRTIHSGGR